MIIDFTKMHGLGNDFILLENINPDAIDLRQLAITLCNRQLGIGADGIILVLPSDMADTRMRIINSDGSEANMCGNGIRCFAKLVFERGKIAKQKFTVETFAGIIVPELNCIDDEVKSVTVNMGAPILQRSEIPMIGEDGPVVNEDFLVNGQVFKITSMLMGVPHTMVFVDDLESADILDLGPQIEKDPRFPKKTNVNFVQVLNENEIKVRTWERGAGATLACGTGSCASGVASNLIGKTAKKVTVHLQVGDLIVDWSPDNNVYMTGPAVTVFKGQVEI